MKQTIEELRRLQSQPLDRKIIMTRQRIMEWVNHYGEDGVYVSFSGGKDSTVLLDIVRNVCGYKNIPAVFIDTGLEYPEIREFVKSYENVVWLKPKMNFRQVIETYGYPIISKDVSQRVFDVTTMAKKNMCGLRETKLWERHFNPESDYCKKYPTFSSAKYDYLFDAPFKISNRCCSVMKKKPANSYEKETERKPILGTMAWESRLRAQKWLQKGCNAFDVTRPISTPIAFWKEQDILLYINQYKLPICSVYGEIVEICDSEDDIEGQLTISDIEGFENIDAFDAEKTMLKTTGCSRTGCMFCMYGCTSKSWNNFERMKKTHPKIYDYIMRSSEKGGLDMKEVCDWLNEHGDMDIKY